MQTCPKLCLWEQSIEGARPPFWYRERGQCQLASPSLGEKNQSCLSKHILLPNFLCSVALASRCVLSVPFPEPAHNRKPAPPPPPSPNYTGCSLWRRKNSQNSHFQRTHRRLFPVPLSPRMGRTLGFDMIIYLSFGCFNAPHNKKQSLLILTIQLYSNLHHHDECEKYLNYKHLTH